MEPLQKRWFAAFIILLSVVSVPNAARAQDAEVVIEWNRIWQAAQATPGAQSPTNLLHPSVRHRPDRDVRCAQLH
jgi:hypothetical protein